MIVYEVKKLVGGRRADLEEQQWVLAALILWIISRRGREAFASQSLIFFRLDCLGVGNHYELLLFVGLEQQEQIN